MAIFELLTIRIGGAVARGLVTLLPERLQWIDDSATGAAEDSVSSLLTARDRGRVARQVEGVEELVADRLNQLITTEFRGLATNEIEAAIGAAGDTLQLLTDSNLALQVVRASGSPGELRRFLVEADAGRPERDLLGAGATSLYEVLLRECCNYLVLLAQRLDEFQPKALIEILRREAELVKITKLILDRIPERPQEHPASAEELLQYMRDVSRRLDTVSLHGVDLAFGSKHYSLSTSWVDLNAVVIAGSRKKDAQPVNAILADQRRIILRGDAGSGKTTLVQWLAVGMARGSVPSQLDGWRDGVPVYVPFRRFDWSNGGPSLAEVLQWISPNTRLLRGDGSFVDSLDVEHLVFLLDGLDEVSPECREMARNWSKDLLDRYRSAAFVITSRPLAVDESWSSLRDFALADLQPLRPVDVNLLVRRWYSTQIESSQVAGSERIRIAGLRDQLINHLDTSAATRDIASTPLLCALLCALNLDRSGQLPKDRMELYRVALSSLLVRRDLERNLMFSDALSEHEGRIVLQELAWWMALNSKSVVRRSDLESAIDRRLPHLPDVELGAAEVASILLERSGLLRIPEVGSVDFIHRSFQEFLAAQAAVDANHIELLVEKSALEPWFTTVAMSHGHANSVQRFALVQGLIVEGDRQVADGFQGLPPQHAVAAMCLEYHRVIDPDLHSAIAERLSGLLPPQSQERIALLIASGDIAVRLLDDWFEARRPVEDVMRCILVLRSIRGEGSLRVLRRIWVGYGSDEQVALAIVDAGLAYPQAQYLEHVFSGTESTHSSLTLTADQAIFSESVDQIAGYTVRFELFQEDSASDEPSSASLHKAQGLDVVVAGALDLSALPSLPNVKRARISGGETLRSYAGLQRSPEIEEITLVGVTKHKYANLAPIRLSALKRVRTYGGTLDPSDRVALETRGVEVSRSS